jgi:hypothetical protein
MIMVAFLNNSISTDSTKHPSCFGLINTFMLVNLIYLLESASKLRYARVRTREATQSGNNFLQSLPLFSHLQNLLSGAANIICDAGKFFSAFRNTMIASCNSFLAFRNENGVHCNAIAVHCNTVAAHCT